MFWCIAAIIFVDTYNDSYIIQIKQNSSKPQRHVCKNNAHDLETKTNTNTPTYVIPRNISKNQKLPGIN